MRNARRFAGFTATVLVLATQAHAGFITGYGWVTTEANAHIAAPATLNNLDCSHGAAACTAGNADISFTTNGINFYPGNGSILDATFAQWLASSLFALDNLVDKLPSPSTTPMSPSIWQFTGTASFTTGQSFSFNHDDGVTFIVNGVTLVSAPGPSGPAVINGTYNGAPGNLPFNIVYAENSGGGNVFQTNLVGPANNPAPEPMSFLLMGSGLAFGGLLRRHKRCQSDQSLLRVLQNVYTQPPMR